MIRTSSKLKLVTKNFANGFRFRRFSKASYAFGNSNDPLLSETISEVLTDSVAKHSKNLAIISQHQQLFKTYFDLDIDATRLAAALQDLGVSKGDRVGVWSPNCYEWVVIQFATAKLGAILVNVNPGYRETELTYCLNLVGCHTLISCQQFKSSNYLQILEKVSPGLTKSGTGLNVVSKSIPSLKNLIFLNQKDEIANHNLIRFDDLLKFSNIENFKPKSEPQLDEPVNIQFTSGTTGNPKGATLSNHNLVNNAFFVGKRWLEGLDDKIICVPNPLYHCFGSVNGTLLGIMFGATVVLPSPTANPVASLQAIQDLKCDIIYGTPTMFVDIVNCQGGMDFKRTSLRRAIMSGAPCPVETVNKLKNVFPNCSDIMLPYGTTETSPVITSPPLDTPSDVALRTVGKPLEHVEIKICDPISGAIKKINDPGEVRVRGFLNFIGYWNEPIKTAESFDENRFYKTGDIGVINEDGYLSIVGRIKDMIIRGGENVYPREIEDLLITHHDVIDANVIGVYDERLGEEIVACVIKKTDSPITEEEVIEFCKQKISHFKVPRRVLFMSDFPRTVTMKVQKHRLKDIVEKEFASQSKDAI